MASPGWIVFSDDHGNNRYAIDMTPAPQGHLGQVIALPVDEDTGACLKAHSLTDFVQGRFAEDASARVEAPVIASVCRGGQQGIEAIAHPDLEVLLIRKMPQWEGESLGLAPLTGMRRSSNSSGVLAVNPHAHVRRCRSSDAVAARLTTVGGRESGATAYSPDGACIAIGSTDGTARIWNACTGVQLATLTAHEGPSTAWPTSLR
jgi:hypothetical protein